MIETFAGPRRDSIEIPDGRVSVLAWPKPEIVSGAAIHFAHANGFNAQTYVQLLTPLAKGRLVMASDLRGHGHSQLAADPVRMRSWMQYAHDLGELLKRLPGGPFVLGGHSMGATTSLLAAAQNPNLVRGLVLAEPVIMPSSVRWMARAAQALGFYDRVMPMAAQARRRKKHWPSIQSAFQAYRGRGAFKTWPDETLTDYLTGGLVEDPSGGGMTLACAPDWEAANYAAGPPSVTSAIAKLQAPVVLLTGGLRSTCPLPVARWLASRAKNLKWLHFPECSHFLPMERPGAVADSLQAMSEY